MDFCFKSCLPIKVYKLTINSCFLHFSRKIHICWSEGQAAMGKITRRSWAGRSLTLASGSGSRRRQSHHFRWEFKKTLERGGEPTPLLASFTIFASLQSPPKLEGANLPVQSLQFTTGKAGAQNGKWLGQGHGAQGREMELTCVSDLLPGGHCPPPSPPHSIAQFKTPTNSLTG